MALCKILLTYHHHHHHLHLAVGEMKGEGRGYLRWEEEEEEGAIGPHIAHTGTLQYFISWKDIDAK